MGKWSLSDIAWEKFDRANIQPELVPLIKAACMVEHNGYDYARYLCEVFEGDAEFQAIAQEWAVEEVQHGQALRKWAELADPKFDFEKSFHAFTTGYQLPLNVSQSVRGSRCGELVARCIVETGTSSYYTAIKDYAHEPVLRDICARIAADEFRHYKLFYDHLNRYLEKEQIGALGRLKVALGRIAESEDDELAYAFFAAQNHDANTPYNRKLYTSRYLAGAYAMYRRAHVDRMVAMVFKAVGLKPHGWLNRAANSIAWNLMQFRARRAIAYSA